MLVISYKRDYTNTCRGCTMESYGSDFQISHFVTEEEAIEHCAQLNASTQFHQINGEDAWEHYFINDGFERQFQIEQHYDPELDGPWTSQKQAEVLVAPFSDQNQKINARTKEIYGQLVAKAQAEKAAQEKKAKDAELQRKIAQAKKLMEQHPDAFKENQ